MAEINEAAKAFGLTTQGLEKPTCEVWSENWPAVSLFREMQTQWRMGPSGPVGLDYSALPGRMGINAGNRSERQVFNALQVMESEALKWFAEQRGSDA